MSQSSTLQAASKRFAHLGLYINGEWSAGTGDITESVFNPANGEVLGLLPHATQRDLEAAVEAASKGFVIWSQTSAIERRRVLMEAASLLRQRSGLISQVLTLEQGKTLAEARLELGAAIDVFEWYAEETRRLYGRIIPARQSGVVQSVELEPIGPVVAFTPWNFPALTPARKIAGAIAAGCSCIIKASEETPATCVELVRACIDAGLPAGVLNLVFGVPSDVSEALVRHPAIRKISFTGSIAVGRHLAAMASQHGLKRCTLELGGHAPVVVFDDADVESAAAICAAGRFRNAGQVCVAPSRFYVQRGVYARFVAAFSEAAEKLVLGNGADAATTMGPLASPRRVDAMEKFVEDALSQGARLVTGGHRGAGPGYFFQPTVLAEVADSALAMCDETFGPIAPVAAFDSFDEAMTRANGLPFGLAAFAFTRSALTMTRAAHELAAGMVGINNLAISVAEAPFGGIKQSGYGSEGGTEGLSAYLSTKFVSRLPI
ncbi:putative NAD-dependent aldehyde dehydrogenase [Pusillimonas sp. T7-7]|uniref:NAD-dependent succinate-semialdehyde dehydrogenase n=1 Tax=Pusillimonas sp. (strain T7-7) TaxID=1007105 RepID=UPI0002085434|nr:NAD-dependent succinate-semialdehyde dehydrogenase [Pusillimonas sp. T7-7]AEC20766.1 putative NAD-dependent aldehyde dehydrogenase [Pusillimonas sp. T7-7]